MEEVRKRSYNPYAAKPKLQRRFSGRTFNRVGYALTLEEARSNAQMLKSESFTTKTRIVYYGGGRDGENAGYVLYARDGEY